MSIFHSAIVDEKGQVDIGNLSLFWVLISVLGSITFVSVMSAWSFGACVQDMEAVPPVLCRYDPQPFGIAVGAICGGFATALGALGVYMRLVQAPKDAPLPSPVQVQNADIVTTPATNAAGPAAAPAPSLPPKPKLRGSA